MRLQELLILNNLTGGCMEPSNSRIDRNVAGLVNRVYNLTQGTITAFYLKSYQDIVRITTTAGSGNMTVYLPPVSQCIGKLLSIMLIARGSNEVVSIADIDDSLDWVDITNMDAVNDSLLLYCDGLKWHVVKNDIA